MNPSRPAVSRLPRCSRYLVTGLLLLALSGCDAGGDSSPDATVSGFQKEVVDSRGPNAPWGKAVGDINGDGLPDIVIGGHRPRHLTLFERILRKVGLPYPSDRKGELVWYENPSWERHLVSEQFTIRTDIEVSDVNGDGSNDIVALTDEGVVWFANGGWEPVIVDPDKFHDLEILDLDGDGEVELVLRNQSLFGYENGNFVRIRKVDSRGEWLSSDVAVHHGEGLALADIDADGLTDIVVNDVWLKNPGGLVLAEEWRQQSYTRDSQGNLLWDWGDVFIDTADLNNDGYLDILLAPSEEAGRSYDIAWFINPGTTGKPWRKELVDKGVESVHHFVAARDADGDGDIDVFTAEMNQGEGENPVSLYINTGDSWERRTLSLGGAHSLRAVDIDGDFDIDLVGTNWEISGYTGEYPVFIWRNHAEPQSRWGRHVVDDRRPGQATAVFPADLDGDGLKDIVTGGYWYRNPGNWSEDWRRAEFGDGATDAFLAADIDGDGDNDVMATGWYGYQKRQSWFRSLYDRLLGEGKWRGNYGHKLFLAANDGRGRFVVQQAGSSDQGDFLQGALMLAGRETGQQAMALSWHKEGTQLQQLVRPVGSGLIDWRVGVISSYSQNEDLSGADLNLDGLEDVVLGTYWLRQTEMGSWVLETIDPARERPDRNEVADIDGDGRPDVIVGFEAISRTGDVLWYRNSGDFDKPWSAHLIGRLIGPMSLDTGDLDGDGDIDVVIGEHNLRSPEHARMTWFENLGEGRAWQGHLVYRGDEHHDGARLVDLDNDGDLDILSIGWGHKRVIVYENRGK